jgi:hypothetical protein
MEHLKGWAEKACVGQTLFLFSPEMWTNKLECLLLDYI